MGGGGIQGGGGTGSGGAAGGGGSGGGGAAGAAGAGSGGGGGRANTGSGGGGGRANTGSGGGGGNGGGAGTGGAGGGKVCGGLAGIDCGPFEWCDFPNDTCGAANQQGTCKPRDASGYDCATVACGCDGQSYQSACSAHSGGKDTTATPTCIKGNGGAGAPCAVDADCATGSKCCHTGGAIGLPIACMQLASGSGCPLLP